MVIRETLRRAVTSFLAIPTAIIAAFVLVAIGAYGLDQADPAPLRPFSGFMRDHVFGDPDSTATLLGTIATGVITITSITFSLLLLALQQSAGSLTHQVFDQFLRRRLNQVYFGFFVGMAVYALIMLATVDPPFNPVLGATLALTLAIVALYILLLLIHSTISQMRPSEIIKAIHDHTLKGRERQLVLVRKTHRAARMAQLPGWPVTMSRDGYITGLDFDAIGRAIDEASSPVEIEFLLSLGSYVAYGDTVAMVRSEEGDEGDRLTSTVQEAVKLNRVRRLDRDPAYGIEQLETIAWRSISTSQQNPSPGKIVIHNLRDLLARWAAEEEAETGEAPLSIVYPDDVMSRLLGAFESLAVVASESMQHQTYAEIVRAIAITFDRLPLRGRLRVEDLVLRTLSGLGDHMLTTELDDSLTELANSLERGGHIVTMAAVRRAQTDLAASIGTLNSRATRVPNAG